MKTPMNTRRKTLLAVSLMLLATPALANAAARGEVYTGTIRVAKVLCPTGKTCPVPISLEIDGVDYPIDTSTWFKDKELEALDGATVKMAGNLVGRPVGGGSHAIIEGFAPASDVLVVEGKLGLRPVTRPYTAPGSVLARCRYLLSFAGRSLPVDGGKNDWSDLVGKQASLTGTLSADPAGQIFLEAWNA